MSNRFFSGTVYGLAVMAASGMALVSQQVLTDPLPRKVAGIVVLVVIVAPFAVGGALVSISAASQALRAGTRFRRRSQTGSRTFAAGSIFSESETKR